MFGSRGKKVKSSVLDTVILGCSSDIQVEMSNRKLDMSLDFRSNILTEDF